MLAIVRWVPHFSGGLLARGLGWGVLAGEAL
jgi:hypothetical protein